MKQKNPEPLVTPRKKQYRVSRASRTSKEPEYYSVAIVSANKVQPEIQKKKRNVAQEKFDDRRVVAESF